MNIAVEEKYKNLICENPELKIISVDQWEYKALLSSNHLVMHPKFPDPPIKIERTDTHKTFFSESTSKSVEYDNNASFYLDKIKRYHEQVENEGVKPYFFGREVVVNGGKN